MNGLLIFLIILVIVEFLTILYYKKKCRVAEKYMNNCKEIIDDMLEFIDGGIDEMNKLIEKEKQNESN